jgi:hypothetical protein
MQYTLVNFIIHATEVNYEDKLLQTTSVKDMYIHYEIWNAFHVCNQGNDCVYINRYQMRDFASR